MMNHVMIDIETLGVSVTSPVVSIGACFFDPMFGTIGQGFYERVDMASALSCGTIEASTIEFWMTKAEQPARDALFDGERHIMPVTLKKLSEFFLNADADQVYVWAKGPSFDIAILERLYALHLQRAPWHYRNVRDVRTVEALAEEINPAWNHVEQVGTSHNALSDAIYQARCVSAAWSTLIRF